MNVMIPVLWFVLLGIVFGVLLAIASRVFAVKKDERVSAIESKLPGANCGGCGYSGCSALAQAIVQGEAPISACSAGGQEIADQIAKIMGCETERQVRMRAQVMCSGTLEFARKKYRYAGADDCAAAARLGGGDKLCPNGCIGLGTCVKSCPFGAISVRDGVASVDYAQCRGCGVCVAACPKNIIKLIPYESEYWVGCMSVDDGKTTRKYCDVGCISCRMCEKGCPTGAISVNDYVASIDYEKCIGCGACALKCPRQIIASGRTDGSTDEKKPRIMHR